MKKTERLILKANSDTGTSTNLPADTACHLLATYGWLWAVDVVGEWLWDVTHLNEMLEVAVHAGNLAKDKEAANIATPEELAACMWERLFSPTDEELVEQFIVYFDPNLDFFADEVCAYARSEKGKEMMVAIAERKADEIITEGVEAVEDADNIKSMVHRAIALKMAAHAVAAA
jgi:hypothetical protein